MAHLNLSQRQALLLQKVLAGTLCDESGRPGSDWRGIPELAAVHQELEALRFDSRACLVCGATFEPLNPRRTTCSDRCRQALSRSKRSGSGHVSTVTELDQPPAPPKRHDPPARHADTVTGAEVKAAPFDFSSWIDRDPNWDQHVADAKAIGIKRITGDDIREFKGRHGLPKDQPLSPEAQELFREERAAATRAATGRAIDIQQRRQRLQERATTERLEAIASTINGNEGEWITWQESDLFNLERERTMEYLVRALGQVGIEPRRPSPKLWQELYELIPAADQNNKSYVFWGVAMRLGDLKGEPPADIAELLKWAGYPLSGPADNPLSNLAAMMSGCMTPMEALGILGLPSAGITRQGIRAAYKAKARKHHPDAGGDPDRFRRMTEARDSLLKLYHA